MTIEQLKYPIGTFQIPEVITTQHLKDWIQVIADFPIQVADEVEALSSEELAYRYRPEGWTIQQVVSHCVDSHMNSVIRFKLALTEDVPTIRPYREDQWALLADTLTYPIMESVNLLKGIHTRWEHLLIQMTAAQFERTFIHPDGNEEITLKENLCIYAWHCQHHLQHIKNAKQFKY